MAGKRVEKIQIHVNDEELAAIDEWRFEHRMPSRSAAVRAMLHVALNRKGPKVMPLATVVSSREAGVVEASPALSAALGTGARPKALLVEDEYLIAVGLEAIVEELGFDVLGPVANSDEARGIVEANRPDVAVLDVDLGGATSFDLALLLQRQRIPFVFCSGMTTELPEALKGVPVVAKPFVKDELAAHLAGLTRTRTRDGMELC
ncbi:MAG: response regulator [Alphaproteobacteria bacterium]